MNAYWRFILWRQSWGKVILNQTIHRSLASLCCITKDEIGVVPKGACDVIILPHSVTWEHSLMKCWLLFFKSDPNLSVWMPLNLRPPAASSLCSLEMYLLTGYVFTCSDFSTLDYGDLEAFFLKAHYQILKQIYSCAEAMFNFLIHLCCCTVLRICQYFFYWVSLSACARVLDRNLV